MTGSPPPRMEPIATLPVFFKLDGRRVVLAGGGEPAVWKAALLSAAGAIVEVFSAEPHEEIVAMAASPPAGAIILHRRPWRHADLTGAALALGAIDDEAEASRFQRAAQHAGVPVNVIDKPAFCDFQFGTVVSRSPLVIGISTDGAAPVLGQAIRTRIEALLPQNLRAWALAAKDWRPAVQARGLDFRSRRRFWEAFAERALTSPAAAPTEADRDACMAAGDAAAMLPVSTTLTLVGIGTGAADGITLAAFKAMQDADVVIHSADMPTVVVDYARREASRIVIAGAGDSATAAVMASLARHGGRRHVWIDTGDPFTCERWAARRASLSAGGVEARRIAGLGPCAACLPSCPAWRPPAP